MSLLKAFANGDISKNIKTEMQSGKPQKQALAIALDVQRKSKAKSNSKIKG